MCRRDARVPCLPGAGAHCHDRGVPAGLLERQDHLDVLLASVAAARAGDGRVVLLTGEPGIGKTSLVGALRAALDARRVDAAGVRVLAGACDDLLAPRALGAPFFIAIAVAAGQALWHYTLIRERGRDGCFKAFRLNHWLGFAVFAGIVAGYALK